MTGKMTRQSGFLRRAWDGLRSLGGQTREVLPAKIRSFVSALSSSATAAALGLASVFGYRARSVYGTVYADSSWVYVCAGANALAAAKAPWVIQVRVNGEWLADDNNTATDLRALIEDPHPRFSWSDLVTRGLLDLQLAGNMLWRLTRDRDEETGAPRIEGEILEIWPVWMTRNAYPVINEFDEIVAYKYTPHVPPRQAVGVTVAGTEREVAAPNTVHAMLVDPDSIYWGMGRLEAASKSVTTDTAAARTQEASMVRGFNPSGVLSLEDPLSDAGMDGVKARFETRHAGPDNAGSLLVVDGTKAKFTSMDPTSKELGYSETRKATRDEILSIFGVPGPVVNVLDHATYNNASAMYQQWWLATLTPLLGIVQRAVNHQLVRPNFGNDVRVVVDTTKIPELLTSIKGTTTIALDLQKLGYSADQINDRLALGMPSIDQNEATP